MNEKQVKALAESVQDLITTLKDKLMVLVTDETMTADDRGEYAARLIKTLHREVQDDEIANDIWNAAMTEFNSECVRLNLRRH